MPSSKNAADTWESEGSSTLLAAKTTCALLLRRMFTSSLSSGVGGCRPSKRQTMTSASAMASMVCSRTDTECSMSPMVSNPPVSTRSTSIPSPTFHLPYILSRVMPRWGPTMALRSPTSRLKRVDLPALGLPTMATTGIIDTPGL